MPQPTQPDFRPDFRPAILPAEPADASEILALQRLAYRSEARLYGDWSLPPLTQSLEEMAREFATLRLLKAVEQDRIVGSVRAGLEGNICRVGRLIVHPERQRRGLGTALLLAVEALFPEAERLALFTGSLSEGNLRLYGRLGYREVARREAKPGLTLVFLEKPAPARG